MPQQAVPVSSALPAEPSMLVPFRKADRARAFEQLLAFAGRTEFRASFAAAQETFGGAHMDAVWEDPTANAGFTTWYLYDYDDRGRTLCERFLETRGTPLSPAERRYLQRMRDTRMGLYEIAEVRLEQGLTLVDQLTAERLEIAEKLLTSQVFAYDVIAGRVVFGPGGEIELDGAVYVFKQHDVETIVSRLRSVASTELKEYAGVAINRHYIENVVLRPMPKVLTPEGHETMPSRAVFEIHADPRAKLAADRRFRESDDGSFSWMESARSSRLLGEVTLEDGRLVLETMSRERAEKGRRLLTQLLGSNVTFERIESESLASVLKKLPKGRRSIDEDPVPSEIQMQILDPFLTKHYGDWLDQPIPALDGKTPRQAARDPKLRARVVALIKEIESGLAGQRRRGETKYSAAWMFGELGLDPTIPPSAATTTTIQRPANRGPGNEIIFSVLAKTLGQRELDELGDFLGADDAPNDRLPIVAAEGFFAALHSGPELIPPSEWLPIVLGTEPPKELASPVTLKRLISLIMGFYNDVGTSLADPTAEYEPGIGDDDGALSVGAAVLWSLGYFQGMRLRIDAWEPLAHSDAGAAILPIFELSKFADPTSRKRLDSAKTRRDAEKLAVSAMAIYDFWLERRLNPSPRNAKKARPAVAGRDSVHRLKITLRGVRPPVWRRLEVASGAKLPQVSRAILAAMGWTDTHLHGFNAGKKRYGVPDPDFPSGVQNERNVTLAQIAPRARNSFDYDYDFGNDWRHRVTVEAIVDAEPGVAYPRCVAGARACPPEDCGGPYGYAELVANLADPAHPDHKRYLRWDDTPFDPEAFDLENANVMLGPKRRRR